MDVDNKKDVLILGKGPTQRLDHTTVTTEQTTLLILQGNKFCFKSTLQWKQQLFIY